MSQGTASIAQHCKALRLAAVGAQFASVAEEANQQNHSHALPGSSAPCRGRGPGTPCDRVAHKGRAHSPRMKTLEQFDFPQSLCIPASRIGALAEGGYLECTEPILLVGEPGTSKSHLATGVAIAACRQRRGHVDIHRNGSHSSDCCSALFGSKLLLFGWVAVVAMADRVEPLAWAGHMHVATPGHGCINLLVLLWYATWNEENRRLVFAHAHYALGSQTRSDDRALSAMPDDAKATHDSRLQHQGRRNAPPGTSLHIGGSALIRIRPTR